MLQTGERKMSQTGEKKKVERRKTIEYGETQLGVYGLDYLWFNLSQIAHSNAGVSSVD
jgi:hypothetical protein